MKNDKRSAVGLIYFMFDLLVLVATYWLTYWFKLVLLDDQNYIEIFELYLKSMAFVFPVFLLSYMFVTLYSNMRTQSKGALLFLITEGNVFGTLFLTLFLFFVKVGTSYFEYRKHGQFEFAAPCILFACLIFTLTAPLYIWTIL